MPSLEHFDLLLGECLERLIEASDEIRAVEGVDEKPFVMQIGRVVTSIWHIRDDIYEMKPDLRRDFVEEREADPARFEELNALFKKAIAAEKQGDPSTAESLYKELFDRSDFGYFKLLAEAGLFRIGQ